MLRQVNAVAETGAAVEIAVVVETDVVAAVGKIIIPTILKNDQQFNLSGRF